jgi:Beta-galactosidase
MIMRFLIVFLFLGAETICLAQSASSQAPAPSVPTGLFVCRGPGPTPEREVNFPFIDGWLVRPGWEAVEPAEGKYDWRLIEGDIALAKRLGKKITLAILGGPQAPSWVYHKGAKELRFTTSSRYHKPEEARIPVLWDEAYLRLWTQLIGEAGKHFAKEATIVLVHISGATENGLELQLPSKPADREQYSRWGYAPEKVVAAWKRIIDTFAEAFPQTPLDLDLHPVLGSDQVAAEAAAYGHRHLGKRFGISGGWLSGKPAGQDRHHAGMHSLAQKYGPLSFSTFQMIGNETNQPERFAPGGVRAAAHQGMSWNAHYFEIWRADVLNPKLHDGLQEIAAEIRKMRPP